ncbi:MAG: hypothetical protein Wins2KO_19380 [Winogradskyella sp.]
MIYNAKITLPCTIFGHNIEKSISHMNNDSELKINPRNIANSNKVGKEHVDTSVFSDDIQFLIQKLYHLKLKSYKLQRLHRQ